MAELLLLATDPTSQMFISSKYFTLRLLDCIRFNINLILMSILFCLTCTSNRIIVRQIMNCVLYSFGPKNVIIPSVFWRFCKSVDSSEECLWRRKKADAHQILVPSYLIHGKDFFVETLHDLIHGIGNIVKCCII